MLNITNQMCFLKSHQILPVIHSEGTRGFFKATNRLSGTSVFYNDKQSDDTTLMFFDVVDAKPFSCGYDNHFGYFELVEHTMHEVAFQDFYVTLPELDLLCDKCSSWCYSEMSIVYADNFDRWIAGLFSAALFFRESLDANEQINPVHSVLARIINSYRKHSMLFVTDCAYDASIDYTKISKESK